MRFIQVTLTLALTMGLFGCTNLKEVQDFAGQSAKLSGYTELTTRFRDTYYREQPFPANLLLAVHGFHLRTNVPYRPLEANWKLG